MKHLKKLIDKVNSPAGERLLMVLLPCAALLVSLLILLPGLTELRAYREKGPAGASAEPTAAPVSPSQAPAAAEPVVLSIQAVSSSGDMLIVLRDGDGEIFGGESLELMLSSGGREYLYYSGSGSCYIVELEPGEYTVSLGNAPGYEAESVKCSVAEAGAAQSRAELYALLGLTDESGISPAEMEGAAVSAGHDTPALGTEPGGRWVEQEGSRYYIESSGSYATGLKKIDGKLFYFDINGRCASRLGVDVSCFNAAVNWPLLKAQGIDYAIVRAGGRGWQSGLVYADSMLLDHIYGAKAAHIKVGAYFYSAANTPAEAEYEAETLLSLLEGMELEMPIYIDMEYSGDFPYGRADSLNTAQRTEIIRAFCAKINEAGYEAGVYSGEALLSSSVDQRGLEGCSVWVANYTENNALPAYPHSYEMWQFTDRGIVPGIGGYADLNVIF